MIDRGWSDGPSIDKHARWEPAEVGAAVQKLLSERPTPKKVYGT
jgi:hypothetical protein